MFLKNNFIVLKLKRNFISLLFLLFTLSILIFSNSNLSAVKSGINLWATSVVPSLFPFFVATELLMHTNIVYHIGNILNRFMKPLFNIRGEGAFAFIMGIISGYPIGAKIATNFRKENICTKEECERLLSFTNNSGPLFIIGSVGILLYRNTMIGILLFMTHLLASLSVGIIFRFWKKAKDCDSHPSTSKTYANTKTPASFSNLGEILNLIRKYCKQYKIYFSDWWICCHLFFPYFYLKIKWYNTYNRNDCNTIFQFYTYFTFFY